MRDDTKFDILMDIKFEENIIETIYEINSNNYNIMFASSQAESIFAYYYPEIMKNLK